MPRRVGRARRSSAAISGRADAAARVATSLACITVSHRKYPSPAAPGAAGQRRPAPRRRGQAIWTRAAGELLSSPMQAAAPGPPARRRSGSCRRERRAGAVAAWGPRAAAARRRAAREPALDGALARIASREQRDREQERRSQEQQPRAQLCGQMAGQRSAEQGRAEPDERRESEDPTARTARTDAHRPSRISRVAGPGAPPPRRGVALTTGVPANAHAVSLRAGRASRRDPRSRPADVAAARVLAGPYVSGCASKNAHMTALALTAFDCGPRTASSTRWERSARPGHSWPSPAIV